LNVSAEIAEIKKRERMRKRERLRDIVGLKIR
jgi:hypothetical protein